MPLTVTYTFAPGAVIYASRFNTNFTDIQNWANAHETDNSDIHGITGSFLDTGSNQGVSGQKTFDATKLRLAGAGAGVASLQNANTATNRTYTIPDVGANASLVAIPSPGNKWNQPTSDGSKFVAFPTPLMMTQWGYYSAKTGASPGGSFNGVLEDSTIVAGTNNQSTETSNGVSRQCVTTAAANNDAYFTTNNAPCSMGHSPFSMFKFKLSDTTNIRFFSGLSASAITTVQGSDDPGINHIGIQFSTNRGDTTFKITRSGNPGPSVVVDTGVAVDTNAHYFSIDVDSSGNIVATLYNASFVSQYSLSITTSLPSASVFLYLSMAHRTLAAATKTAYYYFAGYQHRL